MTKYFLTAIASIAFCPMAFAQSPYAATPYSAQLKTDPAVGNVQGIQRFGRPLKTDPDQGVGYSYHVYPVAHSPQIGVVADATTQAGGGAGGAAERIRRDVGQAVVEGIANRFGAEGEAGGDSEKAQVKEASDRSGSDANSTNRKELERMASDIAEKAVSEAMSTMPRASAEIRSQTSIGAPVGGPFDWTAGIRNYATPGVPSAPQYRNRAAGLRERFERESISVSRANDNTYSTPQIYHQPLVQIKMRVVEVARTDGLAVNSVLEYVSASGTNASRTSGNTANGGNRNFRGLTRYALENLVTSANAGTGTLTNLTTEHINWLVQALATQNNADVITAPEIVTLNGQNAEFIAGSKLPFDLGQNVITGQAQNIQQVFYKHVGTMVSVTPRIVNWGLHGEGNGERSVQSTDILSWPNLIAELVKVPNYKEMFKDTAGEELPLDSYLGHAAVPYSFQTKVLAALNDYSRDDLSLLISLAEQEILSGDYCERCTAWKPSDCTIDLAVVVRLSEAGKVDRTTALSGTIESNVRAISNVIQIKSGKGVVMAGLIGEREAEQISKTPILGDLPVVGSLFRAKTVDRLKTEVLIFIEAEVLDSNPDVARASSYEDFRLARDYVDGDVLDNPLEVGLHRAGIGPYLPATSECEHIFWEKHHRKIRRMKTHTAEVFEP